MTNLLDGKKNDEVHIASVSDSKKIFSNAFKEKSIMKNIWQDIIGAKTQPKTPKLSNVLNNKSK